MSLFDRAKMDIEQITSDPDGWTEEVQFIAPTGETTTIRCIKSKIHLGVDSDGNAINSRRGHISFSEKFLNDANYPLRTNGEVNLRRHRVKLKDSTGAVNDWIIREWFPDETVGLITCMLVDYE